jgi:hypothetical protein
MNVQTVSESIPSCYGKEWDKNEPECAGGHDANFTHPVTGQHVREQCRFFQSCGVRTQAQRTANFVPVGNVVRPNPATGVVGPPQTFGDFLKQQQAAHVEAQRQAAFSGPRPPTPTITPTQAAAQQPQGAWVGGVHHPAPMYQLNYMMPPYLSVPEIQMAGETIWSVLLREILRSMFKALGHAVAHFFDARQLRQAAVAAAEVKKAA